MRALTVVGAVLVMLGAGVARADGFDGQRFVPAAGAAGGLVVERPLVPQHLGFGFGLFLHYGYAPVVDRDRPDGVTHLVLQHALTMDLLASIGLGNIFELAVGLPVDAAWIGDPPTSSTGQRLAAGAGVGDLRLVPKMAWYFGRAASQLRHRLHDAALRSERQRERAARRRRRHASIRRCSASLGGRRWNFTLNLGFRARFASKNPDFTGGKELHWGLAGTFGLVRAAQASGSIWSSSSSAAISRARSARAPSPCRWRSTRALVVKPGREWSIYLGGAGGLDNGLGVPDGRVIVGVRYAHRVPGSDRFDDSDHDGIINGKDRCPDQAEDYDGFEDDDGCPEADNDHDGVLDDDDECPDQAGPRSNDGCPDARHGGVAPRAAGHLRQGPLRDRLGAHPEALRRAARADRGHGQRASGGRAHPHRGLHRQRRPAGPERAG